MNIADRKARLRKSVLTRDCYEKRKGRADIGDGLFATMVTDTTGFVLQNNNSLTQIWFTRDGGRTWAPVTIH